MTRDADSEIFRKPYSTHPDDAHLSVVMRFIPGTAQPWVTHIYNAEGGGGYVHGNYFDTREKALTDWLQRGELAFFGSSPEPVKTDQTMWDDYGRLEEVVKVIPLPGGSRILAGIVGFSKEMLWRKERNKELAHDAQYPILNWEDAEVYFDRGEIKR